MDKPMAVRAPIETKKMAPRQNFFCRTWPRPGTSQPARRQRIGFIAIELRNIKETVIQIKYNEQMPELPEVETIVRCLRRHLVGLEVETVRLIFPPIVRNREKSYPQRFIGQRISGLRRRGKMVLLDFSGGLTMIVHLKMTGRLLFCPNATPWDKHTHFAITFRARNEGLRFRDVRKFGFILGVRTGDADRTPEVRDLGPEPLTLDLPSFLGRLGGRRGRLKSLLLNQKVIAGVGNIYADEILFESGLDPRAEVSRLRRRRLERLWSAVHKVLNEAISFKGTTVRDYRDGEGLEGLFQNRLKVYGREGDSCPRCGTVIKRIRVSGRSTHFCPRCQRR
jgi:formamidopyrimidine-DNA glycosylase